MSEDFEGPATPDFIGQGEFPADLERVNWPAALFSFIWAWVYGVKPWVIGLAALIVVPIVIENAVLLFVSSSLWSPMHAIARPIESAILAAVSVYLGLNANRILWTREQRKFADTGSPRDAIPAVRYRTAKSRWTLVGFVLLAATLIFNAGVVMNRPASWPSVLFLSAPVWLEVIILFAADRVRANRQRSQS